MRFATSLALFTAAAITFFLQVEWLFLTLAVFAAVVLIAEASSPPPTPRELAREEHAEARKTQAPQVVMLQQPSLGREIYEEIIQEVLNDVFKRK